MQALLFIQRLTIGRLILALIILYCLASPLTGCARAKTKADARQWSAQFVEAQRLPQDQQKASFQALLERAPANEQARQARFELGRLELKQGQIELAKNHFQSLWDEESGDAVASRALYELGRLASEHDGDLPRARQLLTQTISQTAPWAGADLALDFLLRLERRQGSLEELATLLLHTADKTADHRMAARLHLERGLLLDRYQAATDEALKAFRTASSRCQRCAATDDALMEMASIYTRYQMWEPAAQALEIVAERYQMAFFVGTYSSHRVSDARFALAELELLFRQDYDAAARHFQIFLNKFPHDQRADDAAWHLVQIQRLLNDEAAYRHALRRFARDYPHSRHAKLANSQLEESP